MNRPPQIKYRGARYRLAALDPKLEKSMLKIRKGSDVTWKELLAIFAHIGWKVERGTGFADSRGDTEDANIDMMYAIDPGAPDRIHYRLRGTSAAPFFEALASEPAQVAYDTFKAKEVSELPGTATPGELYIMNMTEMNREGRVMTWDMEVWLGWHGFNVTAPDGNQYLVPLDSQAKTKARSPQSFALSDLRRWLKKTTFKQDALNALGMEEHVPAAQRTKKNTATCSVCWRNIKLKGTTMVLHGYQRPGWGYAVGSCPGTRQQPYELSAKGCQKYIKDAIDPAIKSAQTFIENGKAGRFKTLTIRKEEITPDDPSWDRYLEGAIASRQNELNSINRDKAKYQALVDGWQRLPLFGEEGFKQLHTDRFMRNLMKGAG